MSKPEPGRVYVYGKYDHGDKFLKFAKPPKASVRQHGTSHAVVTVLQGEYKGQTMPIPRHTIPKGLSHRIWKWFVKVVLIFAALLAVLRLENIIH
ncbi:MAG: hypothetical protein ACM3PY_21370 [Omnitrophica WOR_2 bacterium]